MHIQSTLFAFALSSLPLVGCGAGAGTAKVVAVPVDLAVPAMPVKAISSQPEPASRDEDLVSNKAALPAEDEAVGSPAPGFAVPSVLPKGAAAELRYGRVTVVHFWATWCAPCMRSLPKLDELYAQYQQRGVEVVALSVDDDATSIPEFIKAIPVKFSVAWDDEHKIAELYRPSSMPTTYVIDRAGVVRFVHHGYHDGEDATVEEEIKQLL